MKNKLKKTIAAALAALTMTTAMAGTAGAYTVTETWNLRRITTTGAPSSASVSSLTYDYTPMTSSSKFYSVQESCTYFTSSKASDGTKAKVRYWAYVTEDDGVTVIGNGFSSRYHEGTDPLTIYSLQNTVQYNEVLIVRYELENPYHVACNMQGQLKV